MFNKCTYESKTHNTLGHSRKRNLEPIKRNMEIVIKNFTIEPVIMIDRLKFKILVA